MRPAGGQAERLRQPLPRLRLQQAQRPARHAAPVDAPHRALRTNQELSAGGYRQCLHAAQLLRGQHWSDRQDLAQAAGGGGGECPDTAFAGVEHPHGAAAVGGAGGRHGGAERQAHGAGFVRSGGTHDQRARRVPCGGAVSGDGQQAAGWRDAGPGPGKKAFRGQRLCAYVIRSGYHRVAAPGFQQHTPVLQREQVAPRCGGRRRSLAPGEPRGRVRDDVEPVAESDRSIRQQHQDAARIGGRSLHVAAGDRPPQEPGQPGGRQQRAAPRWRSQVLQVREAACLRPQQVPVSGGGSGDRAQGAVRQPGIAHAQRAAAGDQLAVQMQSAIGLGQRQQQPRSRWRCRRRRCRAGGRRACGERGTVPLAEQPGCAGGEPLAGQRGHRARRGHGHHRRLPRRRLRLRRQ